MADSDGASGDKCRARYWAQSHAGDRRIEDKADEVGNRGRRPVGRGAVAKEDVDNAAFNEILLSVSYEKVSADRGYVSAGQGLFVAFAFSTPAPAATAYTNLPSFLGALTNSYTGVFSFTRSWTAGS